MTHGRSDQQGMTLIEVLVTLLIVTFGIMASMAAFGSFGRAATRAQLQSGLTSLAQREIESIKPVPYAKIGLSGTPSGATSPGSPASSETAITGGVINPGPQRLSYGNVSGTVYRYVTWEKQTCTAARLKIESAMASQFGTTPAAVDAALGDLCPGVTQTKRITIVVVPDNGPKGSARAPIRMSTVIADRNGLLAAASGALTALKVDPTRVVGGPSATGTPGPGSAYASVTSQTLELTDSSCGGVRGIPSSHNTHDSGRLGAACGSGGGPDLMTWVPSGQAASAPVYDYAKDVTRPATGGLALMRDDRDNACSSELGYSSSDASVRMHSLHAWATPAITVPAETAPSAGRATAVLWTSTALGVDKPARLCLVLRRYSTGDVIGSADYQLPAWPGQTTQLSVSFDLAHVVLPVGERLVLTARVPQSSGADVELLYDNPAYPSALTLSMVQGKELK